MSGMWFNTCFTSVSINNLCAQKNITSKLKKLIMERHPQERANFLSKIAFLWLFDLFKFGHRNEITPNDIQHVRKLDESAKIFKTFSLLWATEFNSGRKSLWRVIVKLYAAKVIFFGILFSILDTVCRWVS